MTDDQAYELLQLLHLYVTEYAPDVPQTIGALAEDLAVSLDGVFAPNDKPKQLTAEINATPGVS